MATGSKRMMERLAGIVMTPEDVAIYLQISEKTVIRRIVDGTIPAKRLGSKYRILRKSLDKMMAEV